MTHEMTHTEFFESLTGFDEIAVQKAFGAKPLDLHNSDQSSLLRCLVFTDKRREGMDDKAAKQYAMEATIGECNAYFAEDEEPSPDEPVTESGKDGEPFETPTTGSLDSASEQASSPPSTQP